MQRIHFETCKIEKKRARTDSVFPWPQHLESKNKKTIRRHPPKERKKQKKPKQLKIKKKTLKTIQKHYFYAPVLTVQRKSRFKIKVCKGEVFSKQIKTTAFLLHLKFQFHMTNQENALKTSLFEVVGWVFF